MSKPVMSLEEALRLDALEAQKITDTPQDESFDRIVRLACAALEAPVGAISFLEADRQWLKAKQNLPMSEISRRDSFCTHTVGQDDVMVVEDATQDPRFANNPLVTCEGGVRFYAGAPLTTREGFNVGSLCVADHIPRKISARDRGLLKDFAAIVASELELRRSAGTDMLTGLSNRRLFDDIALHEVARARRQEEPLTVALIDADRFKSINDTFGHPAGDAVLRGLAPVIRKALRAEDQIARYGGEEIAILLPNTNLEHAGIVLDRVRRDIMAMIVPELAGRWVVTASIGAAELQPDDTGIADMLARADAALHRAKEAGRNRLELAEAA
ncbi:MAG TPA: sensor domain-containing diguanylate cyclase [Rhizomicrobium sp.]|nr:sensor domain-containing diguanylate cyclase [Rhizomicrobium sp.]